MGSGVEGQHNLGAEDQEKKDCSTPPSRYVSMEKKRGGYARRMTDGGQRTRTAAETYAWFTVQTFPEEACAERRVDGYGPGRVGEGG